MYGGVKGAGKSDAVARAGRAWWFGQDARGGWANNDCARRESSETRRRGDLEWLLAQGRGEELRGVEERSGAR
ncbi:hypothetical protein VNO80_30722 [Phaseolus coccineus]|uniref:Uncharacterized protein n=1 Tax=Phaseolus coccineus TaxID=3886 RepID=A0AAN9LEC4_PHACN